MNPISRLYEERAGVGLLPAVAVGAVLVVAAVCGVVVAYAVSGSSAPAGNEPATKPDQAPDERTFVSFGSAVANLAEGRLTRYVKVTVSLQVKSPQAADITRIVTQEKKAVFSNWLVTYLSDKQLEDVRGTSSINRLRREIQDGFNAILADYGDYKVDDVYFEEFNVQ